ncbi:MAG: VOC family protein [Thermodesulfobacteriota bacterium]
MELCSLTPNLMVEDVNRTINYYREALGFSLLMAVDEEKNIHLSDLPKDKTAIYAQLSRDSVEIMVQQQKSLAEDIPALANHPISASATLYISVKDIEKLYSEILPKADCVKKLSTTWYNMQEFFIRDINGYILGFAEELN